MATPRPGSIARQLQAAARAEGGIAVPARQPADAAGFPARRQALTPSAFTAAKAQDQSGQVTSGTAFNPAMSVIPNLAYYNDSRNGEGGDTIGEADGFHRGEAEEGGHSHGSGLTPGFNLREVELALSGSVDPYFDAVAYIVVGGGEIEVEEAYVRTRRLPTGLQIKAGRFLSDIGYINRQHPHQWAFANQNLAHDLVLGGGLGETGVQVTWLPPLPVYLQLGAEALQGENEAIAAYVGPGDEHFYFSEASGPRLFTGFAKFSPDLGFNHALQVGGSLARARRFQEEDGDTSLEGHVWLVGLDAVYKYDSPKPHGEDDLVVQGEYLRRTKSLAALPQLASGSANSLLESTQDGFYVQGSYGIAPRLTAAARLDVAGMANSITTGGRTLADYGSSRRFSGALTFDPTEFSRLRFQVDRASIPIDGLRESFTAVWVQLQISLGTHGAHKF